ncbi:hypothetical protein [Caenispirillum bisanense]|uniref:hypothetical protein n=1 Tax=Caenispirillum bisanense TaxID=414052 RepID=UPI0031E13E6E
MDQVKENTDTPRQGVVNISEEGNALAVLMDGTNAHNPVVRHIMTSTLGEDAPDEDWAAFDAAEDAMTDSLIRQRGGVVLAAEKLRLAVWRLRRWDEHTTECLEDLRDYQLIESALLDLFSTALDSRAEV